MVYRDSTWTVLSGIAAGLLAAPALGTDIRNAQPAAVDQPRVTIAFSRPASPGTPLTAGGVFGGQTIAVSAFYDTGASGIVIDNDRADALGIGRQTVGGQPVVFSDIGAEGVVNFAVSEPLVARIAPSLGALDQFDEARINAVSSPANFQSLYPHQIAPVRAQVGPVNGTPNPLIGGISVVGVPAMAGKVVVFDPRPTNNFFTLFDDNDKNDNFDAFMRTHTYNPGTPANPANPLDPGIPRTGRHVSLSYASFDRFTTTSPAGAAAPTLAANPFVGPNPLLALEPGPADPTPPMTVGHNGRSVNGSFLLDTGAAASFISQQRAADLGVSYDPARGIGSASPLLLGVAPDKQFRLTISGIGGGSTNIAGFFADSMLMRTDEGDPNNPDDPNHVRYLGAPLLVFDITVQDPATAKRLTLDGILGMNFFVASGQFEFPAGSIFPVFTGAAGTPYDFFTFDHPNRKLGLALATVPEPGTAAGLAAAGGLLLGRRTRRTPRRRG